MELGDNSNQSLRRFDKNQGLSWGQKKMLPGTWAENSDSIGREGVRDGFKDSQYSSQGTGYARKGAGPVWPKPLYQPKSVSKVMHDTETAAQPPKEPELRDDQTDMVTEDVPVMQEKNPSEGLIFSESTDDLLEDGECHVGDDIDIQAVEEELLEDEGKGSSTEESNVQKGISQISVELPVFKVSRRFNRISLDGNNIQKNRISSLHGIKGVKGSKNYATIVASPGKRLLSKVMTLKSTGDVHKQKAVGKNKPKDGAKTVGANRSSKKGMVALLKPPANT
ncbi:unnamed protein product [Arabidopsis arenosa]|uniref:Uncharacterized protein n=1 Tax=Arabidopsis arenosa TaxID=38785 RepID=A0A8S1ZHN3_ARAAE|nr:unnamed protein product [Arabidopsis arenosa]